MRFGLYRAALEAEGKPFPPPRFSLGKELYIARDMDTALRQDSVLRGIRSAWASSRWVFACTGPGGFDPRARRQSEISFRRPRGRR